MMNLNTKKVNELKEMAKDMGIKGYSKMKKAELIKLITVQGILDGKITDMEIRYTYQTYNEGTNELENTDKVNIPTPIEGFISDCNAGALYDNDMTIVDGVLYVNVEVDSVNQEDIDELNNNKEMVDMEKTNTVEVVTREEVNGMDMFDFGKMIGNMLNPQLEDIKKVVVDNSTGIESLKSEVAELRKLVIANGKITKNIDKQVTAIGNGLMGKKPVEKPQNRQSKNEEHACAECGTAIETKVYNYSMSKYNKPLCRKCQPKNNKPNTNTDALEDNGSTYNAKPRNERPIHRTCECGKGFSYKNMAQMQRIVKALNKLGIYKTNLCENCLNKIKATKGDKVDGSCTSPNNEVKPPLEKEQVEFKNDFDFKPADFKPMDNNSDNGGCC